MHATTSWHKRFPPRRLRGYIPEYVHEYGWSSLGWWTLIESLSVRSIPLPLLPEYIYIGHVVSIYWLIKFRVLLWIKGRQKLLLFELAPRIVLYTCMNVVTNAVTRFEKWTEMKLAYSNILRIKLKVAEMDEREGKGSSSRRIYLKEGFYSVHSPPFF